MNEPAAGAMAGPDRPGPPAEHSPAAAAAPPPVEKPEVVREAEGEVRRLGVVLGGVGAAGTVSWALGAFAGLGPFFPITWLVFFLAALVAFFFWPPTRGARRAREILRRWDELEVRRALEDSGAATDPRLAVADSMARRIHRHPALPPRAGEVATALVERLRTSLADLRTLELFLEARMARREADSGGARSISDLQDHVEARVATLLARLSELHGAVVQRDAATLDDVLEDVEGLLRRLEAEREVERLLGGA